MTRAHVARLGATRLVGRSPERERLNEILNRTKGGMPAVVVVEGDAGIGKTHLLRELASSAHSEGFAVGRGQAQEDDAVPYAVVEQAFRSLLRRSRDGALLSAADLDALATMHGSVHGNMPWSIATDQLIAASRQVPILICLDDVHWADNESLQQVARLAFALADTAFGTGARVVLSLATRPIDAKAAAGRVLGRLLREHACHHIVLAGLDLLDTTELARVVGMSLAPRLAHTLHETTGGNPLFIKGLLSRARPSSELGGVERVLYPTSNPLPKDLAGVVSAQIAATEIDTLCVLRCAALIGRRFSVELLASVLATPLVTIVARLERAPDLVRLLGDTGEIAHPLIHQALIRQTPDGPRASQHATIANAIAAGPMFDQLEHAQQLLLAGNAAPIGVSLPAFKAVASQLQRAYAFGKAARFYEAAARIEPEDGARAELHFCAAVCFDQSHDREAGLAHYDRALAIHRQHCDPRAEARVLAARARLEMYGVSLMELRDVSTLQASLARLSPGDMVEAVSLHYALSDAYAHGQRSADAERHARRAVDLARTAGDDRSCAKAYMVLGSSLAQSMQYEEAEQAQARSAAHARAADDLPREVAARVRRAMLLLVLGKLDAARRECEASLGPAARSDDAGEVALASAVLCGIEAAMGNFGVAEERAHDMQRWSGLADPRPHGAILGLPALAAARHALGYHEDALAALAALTEPDRFVPNVGRAERGLRTIYSALITCDLGAPKDDDSSSVQRAKVQRYAQRTDPDRVDGLAIAVACALCELCVYYLVPESVAGPRAAVERAMARGARLSPGWPMLLARVLANVEAAFGEAEAAYRLYELALQHGEQAGARADLARAHFDFARALAKDSRTGARQRACRLLDQAMLGLSDLGEAVWLPRARNLARTLGLVPPAVRQATPPSAAEFALVHRALASETHEELVDRQLLSAHGLRKRTGMIMDQLGVRGPLELIPHALERGLLPEPRIEPGIPLVLLVSDLQGFTPIVERLGDADAQGVMREHNALIRLQLRENGGLEVTHTGDGFLAAFRSGIEALACAIAIQRALAGRNVRSDPPLHVRIGLHAGQVLPEEGRLFGASVITTVRICAQCPPGRVLLSESLRLMAADARFSFVDRGEHALKGLRGSIRLFELLLRD